MQEAWIDIPGFEGYQISNFGRARSFRSRGRHTVLLPDPVIKAPVKTSGNRITLVIRKLGDSKFYAFKIHRLVWELHVGPIPEGMVIDHIDGNSTNNHLSNLRLAIQQQNIYNSKPWKHKKFKGVTLDRRMKEGSNRWNAGIKTKGKYTFLGSFRTDVEAARAYNEEAIKRHGEFAKLNIID